jgi:hypothetical protein
MLSSRRDGGFARTIGVLAILGQVWASTGAQQPRPPRRRRATSACTVAIAAALLCSTSGFETLTLEQVLNKSANYVREYGEKMSFVVGTEHYSQWVENPGQRALSTTQLESEFAIVRVEDDWLGFRDVHVVNGRPVIEHQTRLQELFLQSPATAIRDARRIADGSVRYNIGSIQRNFNTPTMALFFLQSSSQPRFKFRKTGDENIGGTPVWKVRYEESRRPTLIRTSQGKDMPATGTVWLDPVDGKVLKTQMQIRSEARLGMANTSMEEMGAKRGQWTENSVQSSASITVTYELNSTVGFLVPAEMLETYEGPRRNSLSAVDGTTKISCRATYSDFRRFESTTKWSAPK